MNAKRRKELRVVKTHISLAIDLLSDIIDDEQFALDNVPENLRESSSYNEKEDALDDLRDALSDLESADDSVSDML